MVHKCFTDQLFSEPCLKCGSTENIYVGHGTVRHCIDCVFSWGADEIVLAELAESTMKQKIKELPKELRKSINTLADDLQQAGGIEDRLKRLRSISNSEWQQAEDGDAPA